MKTPLHLEVAGVLLVIDWRPLFGNSLSLCWLSPSSKESLRTIEILLLFSLLAAVMAELMLGRLVQGMIKVQRSLVSWRYLSLNLRRC